MKYLAFILFFLPLSIYGNDFIELDINIGYTAVDLDKLVEIEENPGTWITDWDQFSYGLSLSYYFLNYDNIYLGVLLNYKYLFWYSVGIPYGSETIYREYFSSSFSVSPALKYNLNEFEVRLSPLLIFTDTLSIGFSASIGYRFPVTNSIYIPVSFEFEIRSGSVISLPIFIGIGAIYII